MSANSLATDQCALARAAADFPRTLSGVAPATPAPGIVLYPHQSTHDHSRHPAADVDANAELIARLGSCLDDDEPVPAKVPSSAHQGRCEQNLVSPMQAHASSASSIPQFMRAAVFKFKTPFWSLCNPGNLCFLNSLLQNLARLSPLMVLLEVLPDGSRVQTDAIAAPLASALNYFCSKVSLDGQKCMRAGKTTEAFRRVLPDLIAPFASGSQRQQDVHEVLLRLIEKLDVEGSEAGLRYFNNFAQSPAKHFGHPLPAICTGLVEQEMICSRCSLTSVQKETFVCLSIPIPVQAEVSVESMMSAYFASNEVHYRCSKCDGTAANVHHRVRVWPTVLVVHFLRWRGASKISTKIKMPPAWSSSADKSCPKYKLNGYILHHGPQANVGHYTAVVMISSNGSDEYYRVSDDLIDTKPIEKSSYCREGFPSTTCYLAFYVQT